MIPIYQADLTNGRLTEEQVRTAMQWKRLHNLDIANIDKYYKGQNPTIIESSHEHKIPVPFGRKLIKMVTGFMFKEGAITYAWPDGSDVELTNLITSIYDHEDEQTENVKLGRDQAKYGSAFEILFVDNDEGRPEFSRVKASQVVPIYSRTVKPRMVAAINFYASGDGDVVEVYYADRIEIFLYTRDKVVSRGVVAHQFGEVPVVEFRNNEEGLGDIESILSLIDAHDEILANGLDEDGKYADALLILKNFSLDDEALDKLIRLRVIDGLDSDSEADYLTKEGAYEGREVLRKVIEGLIYAMSGVPNLDDKDAMAQQSGEALKYLYATFEVMVAGDKQSEFTNGLMRRMRLVNNFLTWMGQSTGNLDGLVVNWKRNLPNESTTLVDNVVKAEPIISRKTALEQLQKAGIVVDVDDEETRLEEDRKRRSRDLTNVDLTGGAYGQTV